MVSESETWFKRQRSSKLSQNTFAVIDFGSETTIVNILRNRVLEFNKVILRAAVILTRPSRQVQAKSSKRLKELKKIHGLALTDINADEEQEKIYNSIKSVIDDIIRQMFQCLSL